MPHLYCDRRSDNEEKQKLLHRDVLAELLEAAAQRYGSNTMASWEQLEIVATTVHASGGPTVSVLRGECAMRLVEYRSGLALERAYGCEHDLKRSFTMKLAGTYSNAKQGSAKTQSKGRAQGTPAHGRCSGKLPKLSTQAGPKGRPVMLGPAGSDGSGLTEACKQGSHSTQEVELGVAGCIGNENGGDEGAGFTDVVNAGNATFFQTVRGRLLHVRAPGRVPVRLCSLRTARASAVIGEVVEHGNYETARALNRRFCDECLRRAGIPLA
jgi:hypothetical protein